jgi:BNR repeat-like domain/BNR/Asp-box repeat
MRARRAAALGAFLAIAGCDNSAQPSEPSLPPPRLISGPLSAPSACAAQAPSPGRPAEPSLAADPHDPRQLVASWLENRPTNDIGTIVAVSHDGGQTWSRAALPGLLTCAGGTYVHTSDPWVSIGADGITYVAVLGSRRATSAGTPHDIVVTASRDHGASWDAPVVVETAVAPPRQPDKEAILADPRRPGTAYAVWADYQVVPGVEPSVTQVMFAHTADGGRSWSTPAAIYSGKDEAQENQLLMTAGGVLLDVFVEGSSLPGTPHPPPLPVKIRMVRSTNQGKTWSTPIDAVAFTYTNAVDPGSGGQLRFFGQDITAASAGNAVYVAWFEDHTDFSTVLLARSEDAGVHWRPPQRVVREKAEAFLPTLAVAGDATVGMLWYDFRDFKPGSPTLDTDVWFSSSRDRGVHWTERRAAGPFDLRSAPAVRYGPFIGDYMGLVGLPDGFAGVFVQARPRSRNGPTDVFFSRIAG